MKNTATWLLLFLMSIFLLLPNGMLSLNHTTFQKDASSSVSIRNSPSDHMTILIIDMSAAMIYDDPYQVRCDAARAFIDLSAPGNWVGLIGMSGSKAQVWQRPEPTDAIEERTNLKDVIDHPPLSIPHCNHPTGNAPVADALKLALSLFNQAIQEDDTFQGSVILMSNGVPPADSAVIEHTLLPQFQQNHWPIDTIPLGPADQGSTPHLSLQTIARHTGGIPYPDAQNPAIYEVSSLNILPFFTDILKRQIGNSLLSTLASATPVSVDQPREYNFQVTANDKGLYLLLMREPQDVDSITHQSAVQALVTSAGPRPFSLSTLDTPPPPGTDIEQNTSYAVFSIGGMDSVVSSLPTGSWTLNVSGSGQFAAVLLKTSWLQIALSSPQPDAAPLNIASPLKLVATIVDERNAGIPFQDRSVRLTALLTPQEGQKPTTPPYPLDNGRSPGEYQKTILFPTNMPEGTYTLTVTASKNTDSLISGVTETILLFHFPTPLVTSYQATEYQWPDWASTVYHWPLLNRLGTWMSIDSPIQLLVSVKFGSDTHISAATAILSSQKGQGQHLGIVDQGQGHFLLSLPTEKPGRYALSLVLNGSIDGFPFSSDVMNNLTVQITSTRLPSSMYRTMMSTTGTLILILLLFMAGIPALLYHWTTGVRPFGGYERLEEDRKYYQFNPQGKHSWFRPDRHRPTSEDFGLPEGLRFRFYRRIPFTRPYGCIKVKIDHEDKRISWAAKNHNNEQQLSHSHYRKVSDLTCQVFAHPQRLLPIGEATDYRLVLHKNKNTQP